MIAHRNIPKDIGRMLFWFPLRWVVSGAPDFVVYRLGGMLGDLDYVFSGERRMRRMTANIADALGKTADAKRIVRENLRNHCRNVLEFIRYPRITAANMDGYVSLEGKDLLDRELQKGKGVVLVTGHFGAKQLLQVGLGHGGYRVNQINYHMSGDELSFVQKNVSQKQRKRIEARIPARFIAADGFARPAFTCLKNNEVLIVAGDGSGLKAHMDESYRPFDFMGRRMLFPVGAASLAERTGAAVIPVFVVREKMKHRIVLEPPVDAAGLGVEAVTALYVGVLEKYVRAYPELWEFWEEFDEDCLLVDSAERVKKKCTE